MKRLVYIKRGEAISFDEGYKLQRSLVDEVIADRTTDRLIFLEHQHVFTMGRGELKPELSSPLVADVPWIETNRGGKATYHGPGQLIIYPIFNLENHGKDVHLFLRKLEQAIIIALNSFGYRTSQRADFTGVWIGERKIASIGIGVSKWVSYHGIAININPDLRYFRTIHPCGLEGSTMTSLEEIGSLAGRGYPVRERVEDAVIAAFKEVFQFEVTTEVLAERVKKPTWLKVRAPGSPEFLETKKIVKDLRLHTVCEEARCPNIGECWSHHTATFMIMGELCTRRCSFCAVKDGTLSDLQPLDPLEPFRTGKAVSELGLKHVVITSVDRDDLPDMGAEHFHKTVQQIKKQSPDCQVELLIPDMRGKRELVSIILKSGDIAVLNHNVETVPRLYHSVRPGADFARSLDILRAARECSKAVKTKSGVMLGLGETAEEVLEVMDALREVDCNIMTLGQYLQPTPKQLPVKRFVTPEEFQFYKEEGLKRGFSFVESGPLVRSSYHAWKHVSVEAEKVRLVA